TRRGTKRCSACYTRRCSAVMRREARRRTMTITRSSLSRRDFGLLSANMAVATVIGSAAGAGPAAAAGDTAVLGHFGSANPQTYAKATGAFQQAFGEKEKVDFVT